MIERDIEQNQLIERTHLFMQKKIRRNFIISALYQLVIGVLWGFIPRFLLDIQIDMLAPLSIGNIPFFYGLSTLIIILVTIQLIYGLFLPLFENSLFGKILGWLVGVFMVLFLPFGTFFGIQFLQYLLQPNIPPDLTKNQISAENNSREFYLKNISEQIILSGLYSLFTSGIILWLHKLMLTQQLDMLYPTVTTAKLIAIERFGQIYFILFCFQIFIGCLYSPYAQKSWMRIIVIGLSIFQIISIGIIIQWFFTVTALVMDLEDNSRIIIMILVNFSFLIGIPLNPLGVYFGSVILKAIWNENSIK